MWVMAKNHWFDWSATESPFTLFSIHATLSGTELTIFENGIGLFDLLGQFTFYL
jgi:hypothetical protein